MDRLLPTPTMSAIGAGVGAAVGLTDHSPRTFGAVRALGGVLNVTLAASLLLEVVPVSFRVR